MKALHEAWKALQRHIDGDEPLESWPDILRDVYPYLRNNAKSRLTRYIIEQQDVEAFDIIKNEPPALAPTPVRRVASWIDERRDGAVQFLLDHPDYLERCFGLNDPDSEWGSLINDLVVKQDHERIAFVQSCFEIGFPDRALEPDWSACLNRALHRDRPELVRESFEHLSELNDDRLEDALFSAKGEALEALLDELKVERFANGTYRLQRRLGNAARDQQAVREFLAGTDLAVTVIERLLDNKQLTREGPVELFDELLGSMTDEQCREMGSVVYCYYPCGLDKLYLNEARRREVLDSQQRGVILQSMLINHKIGIASHVQRLEKIYEFGFSMADLPDPSNESEDPLKALAENPEALDMVMRRESISPERLQPVFEKAVRYRPVLRQLVERHEFRPHDSQAVLSRALKQGPNTSQYVLEAIWDESRPGELYETIREHFADSRQDSEQARSALLVLDELLRREHAPEDLHELYTSLSPFLHNNPAVPGKERSVVELLYDHSLHPPGAYLQELRSRGRDDLADRLIERLPGRARSAFDAKQSS